MRIILDRDFINMEIELSRKIKPMPIKLRQRLLKQKAL